MPQPTAVGNRANKGQKEGGGSSTPITVHVASPAKNEAIMMTVSITKKLQNI